MIDFSYSQFLNAGCELEWYNRYVLELKPAVPRLPLNLGSALHDMVAAHWDGDPTTALDSWVDNRLEQVMEDPQRPEMEEIITEVKRLAPDVYQLWIREFKPEDWKPVYVEKKIERVHRDVNMQGVVDFVGVHTPTGDAHIIDWKFQQTMVEPNPFPLQMIIYKWLMAGQRVAQFLEDVNLTTFAIKAQPPHPPSINKNGAVSRQKILCTWPMYLQAIEDANEDPADYEDMHSYFDSLDWSREDTDRWSMADCERIVNQVILTRAIDLDSLRRSKTEFLPTLFGTMRCRTCDFRERCLAQYMEGYTDTEMIEL
jgi:hypothetical protein